MTKDSNNNLPTNREDDFPTVSLPGSVSGDDIETTQIGPYKLTRRLGEGGFGYVYLAEQKKPIKRQVALKIIKPGMDTKRVIARFETERQALALLNHPHIAKVFDAGSTDEGRPYFVMEYVEGIPITDYCDKKQLSIKERLELFIKVCEAIHHAHQKGIIHRDIKPSNVLVSEEDGHAVPKVIDFGIAKAINQDLTEETIFTEQGQLIGTPEYMSPEQADLGNQDIDTLTDVYSLGVLLYELLTGTLPFDAQLLRKAAFREIQRIICEQDPPKPSTRISSDTENAKEIAENRQTVLKRLQKQLHNELEWIPLMAIRKERSRRYQSATVLAEDLQNYLDGNPLLAGPNSNFYLIKKFTKRNRIYMLVTTVLLSLFIAMGLVFFQSNKIKKQTEINNKKIYINNIDQVVAEYYENSNRERARELLKECAVKERGWEWYYLDTAITNEENIQYGVDEPYIGFLSDNGRKRYSQFKVIPDCEKVLFNSDSTLFAVSGSDGTIKIYDQDTGKIVNTVGGSGLNYELMAFCSNGKYFAGFTNESKEIMKVWSTENGNEVLSINVKSNFNFASNGSVAFSPNGKLFAFHGFGQKEIMILKTATGDEHAKIQSGPFVKSVAFSPDGSYIAAKSNRAITLWNTDKMSDTLVEERASIGSSFAFSSDGTRVAYLHGIPEPEIKIKDLVTGREVMSIPLDHKQTRSSFLSFNDSGKIIYLVRSGQIEAWNIQTGTKTYSVNFSKGETACQVIMCRGKVAATKSSSDNSLCLWKLENIQQDKDGKAKFKNYWDTASVMALSSDGNYIAFGYKEGNIKVFKTESAELKVSLQASKNPIKLLNFSPDNKFIASTSSDETLHIWNFEDERHFTFQGHEGAVNALSFSPDSRQVALSKQWMEYTIHSRGKSGRGKAGIEVFELASGKSTMINDIPYGSDSLVYSQDGKQIFVSSKHNIGIYDFGTEKITSTKRSGGSCISYSPDGKLFATANGNNIIISEWKTEKDARLLGHQSSVISLAFNSDASRLISGSNDNTIRVWDTLTGLELLTIREHTAKVIDLIYDQSEDKVVSFSDDGAIKIWRSDIARSANSVSMEELNELISQIGRNIRISENPRIRDKDNPVRKANIKNAKISISEDRNKFGSIIAKTSQLISVCDSEGRTLLHQVARQGREKLAESLLSHGAAIDIGDHSGRTPLYLAASEGHLSTIKLLISYKANVNIVDNFNESALTSAAQNERIEVVKYLVSKGADVNSTDSSDNSVLSMLVNKQSIEGVECLMEHGAKLQDNVKLIEEIFLLAAKKGNNKLLELMINQGVEINIKNSLDETALHSATTANHKKTVQILIANGANVNLQDKEGNTPIRKSLLRVSINDELVKILVENGADLNIKNNKGNTPLHYAVLREQQNLIGHFVSKGADIHALNKSNKSPLDLAEAKGHQDIVKMLIQKTGQIGEISTSEKAIYKAVRDNKPDKLNMLLSIKSVKASFRDKKGNLPLHLATINGNKEIVRLLVNKEIQINPINDYGDTPLHLASRHGYIEIAQLLIDKGAKINLKNSSGDTVLHLVSMHGYKDFVQFLIDKDAKLNLKNNNENTPLYLALTNDHQDIISQLQGSGAVVGIDVIDALVAGNLHEFNSIIKEKPTLLDSPYMNLPPLIHVVAKLNQVKALKALLDFGVDINVTDSKGYSALDVLDFSQKEILSSMREQGGKRYVSIHKAALLGDLKVIKTLTTENKELINSKDIEGMTSLHLAALMGHKDVVKYLLANGLKIQNDREFVSEINERGFNEISGLLEKYSGRSAPDDLDKAVLTGNMELVKKILERQPNLLKDRRCVAVFYEAIKSGNIKLTELLLKYGANANMVLNWGPSDISLLYASIAHGQTEIADILIRNGGTIESERSLGNYTGQWNAELFKNLILAVVNDNKYKIESLLSHIPLHKRRENYRYRTPKGLLFYAVQKNKLRAVEALIENEVSPNTDFDDSNTYGLPSSNPLHWAVRNGNKEIAEYLINNGADVNGRGNSRCESSLSWTAIYNQPQMAFFLIEKGAEINGNNKYPGESSLYLAAKHRNLQVAKILIAHDAEVNAQTLHGTSPLHQAAKNGNEEMIRLLIEKGADVNIKNRKGQTALHMATLMGNKKVAELLIHHGADINAEMVWQRSTLVPSHENQWKTENILLTPLDIAAQWNYLRIAEMLLSKGADLHFAVQRASERDHKEMLKMLVGSEPSAKPDSNVSL